MDKEQEVRINHSAKTGWWSLEQIPVYVVSGLLLLLPLFFIPVFGITLQFSKYLLLVVAVLIIGGVWILQRLKDGVFELPMNMLSLASLATLGTILLATIFSVFPKASFLGQGADTDTFVFYGLAFLLMLLIPSFFKTKRQILNSYMVFLVSVIIVGLLHLTRLAFPGALSLGVLASNTDALIGKWNDLAIFFGLGALISLITLESIALSRVMKMITYIILGVSLFFLALINFSLIWYILGGLALILFVYGVVMERVGSQKTSAKIALPVASCVVLVISVLFLIPGGHIGEYLANKLNVSQVEVRPTWQGTMDIAREVIFAKPSGRSIVGYGPNEFQQAWSMHKAPAINNTIFWNTDFNYGTGIIPSTLVTTGILGFLAWIFFLGTLVYMGFRSILSKISDAMTQYTVVSSFIGALYLWLFAIVYVPSVAVFVLAFIFTGIFIAALTISGILQPMKIEYFKNAKIGFISVFALIIILIVGIGLGSVFVGKLLGASQYNKALSVLNTGNFAGAEDLVGQALRYDANDTYYRGLSQIYLLQLNDLINNSKSLSSDALKAQFSSVSQAALQSGQAAIDYNSEDYRNQSALGDVWAALVPFNVQNAYENAVASYKKVIELNPQNPAAYLQLARVESAHNDVSQAKTYIQQAVAMKYNYTDAYYLLAQIQMSQGDTKNAINSVAAAALSEQTNAGLFYQLGLLYYNQKDYTNTAAALERAVSINPDYSNARYYLGLSYYQLDKTDMAIAQFNEILKLNPDSTDVKNIIDNLKAGRAPVAEKSVAPAPTTASSTAKTTTKKK